MRPAMVRHIDSQGRIIIPKEIRDTMHLRNGDALEIRPFDSGILLNKYTAQVKDPDLEKYLEILYSVIRCSAAICSEEYVIAAKGIGLKEGTSVSAWLAEYLNAQKPVVFEDCFYATESSSIPIDTLIPIRTSDSTYSAMALLLFQNGKKRVSDEERLCARIIAALITAKAL